jgi:iron complex transport system substrate-binding protein
MKKVHLITVTVFMVAVMLLAGLTGCTPDKTTSTVTATTTQTATATSTATTTTSVTETVTTTTSVITFRDQIGRTVTLDKMPDTIISMAPSNTEILFALGLEDRIIGVTDYCNYPEEALEKQSIGGYSDPNIEQIIALDPDIVFADDIHETEIIPALEGYGIDVICLAPVTIEDILDSIGLIGEVAGVSDVSDSLIADMRSRIQAITDVTAEIAPEEQVKTAYVVWHDPLMVSGNGTIHSELINSCGGINIAADLEGYSTISLETVMGADPQVLIAGVGMGAGSDSVYQYLLNETRLEDTAARQNDAVYPVLSDIVDRAGPRIVEAMEQFAAFIHPELFG